MEEILLQFAEQFVQWVSQFYQENEKLINFLLAIISFMFSGAYFYIRDEKKKKREQNRQVQFPGSSFPFRNEDLII